MLDPRLGNVSFNSLAAQTISEEKLPRASFPLGPTALAAQSSAGSTSKKIGNQAIYSNENITKIGEEWRKSNTKNGHKWGL